MSDSIDLFQVGITVRGWLRMFTIRWYAESAFNGERYWEVRDLGVGRFAFDFFHLSLVFEKYATNRTTSEQLNAAREAYLKRKDQP